MRAPHRVVPALVAVLLLGGCSEDPEPRIGTAPSPKTSTSTAPATPSSSQIDPGAETPEEFVERWLAASVEMQNSGLTATYESITTDCAPCRKAVSTVARYYKAGGYIKFDGQSLTSATVVPSIPRTTVVRAVVDARPTEYKASATSQIENFPGGIDTLEVVLVGSASDGWQVSDYVQIAP